MRIALMGDVMLGRLVAKAMEEHPPEYFWGDTLPLVKSADFSLINLECALTRSERAWTRTEKVFHFKTDPDRALQVLKAAHIDFVNLANNHVLDYEVEGLEEMLDTLDRAGIGHCGAGRNRAEASAVKYVQAAGRRIAIFGATNNVPEWQAEDRPGVRYVEFDTFCMRELVETVEEARSNADLVIATLHWGPNMREKPSPEFRTCARALIDSGVDIIHGHSAHVFQGIEIYRNRPILYDTGDFIDDYMVDPMLRNDHSFLFFVNVDTAVTEIELHPTVIRNFQASLADGFEREQIRRKMRKLCSAFDTQLLETNGKLHVVVQPKEEQAAVER